MTDKDDEFWMNLIEPVTKAIVFEDCGNTSDWQDNTNLGIAAVNAVRAALTSTDAVTDIAKIGGEE
jgi:hypothetical protein